MNKFIEYILENKSEIFSLLLEHIQLTAISVGLAIAIGVPLGILICYIKKLHKPILGLANLVQAIPSMALLGFAIPLLGIGTVPAVCVVILYSLLPIIKNTFTGIMNINPQTVEAARAIGLTKAQILTKVQIPLALPVIMAGVRISAVTAVGLMTVAAYIGAGGLGFLVYSGIRTLNNNQILAGAIPACILALIVDYIVGLVEKLVTPISMQKEEKQRKVSVRRRQKGILAGSMAVILCILVILPVVNSNTNEKVISVGGKDFTEQFVVTHLVADAIEERTDISVERRTNLGGSQVCFSALQSKEIDLYIDYSGTLYGDLLMYPSNSDTEEVYNTVRKDMSDKYDIEVLKQMRFNNTYTLAVTQETADKYNLSEISDLKVSGNQLKMGSTLEFLQRDDGLPGLMSAYDFTLKNTVGLDGSPRYTALMNDEVQIVDAFATDGLLKKFDLVVLEDDRHFFPPYFAVPVTRPEVLKEYPEVEEVLNELGELLTDEVMTELNYKVDELGMKPATVAREFLEEAGFIK